MSSLDILYYALSLFVFVLMVISSFLAFYIIEILKSTNRLINKSIKAVDSITDLKQQLNSEFSKNALVGLISFAGEKILKKFVTKKRK